MRYLLPTRALLAASLLAAAAFLAPPVHAASVPGAPAPSAAKAFRAEQLQLTPNAFEPAAIYLAGPGEEAIDRAKQANAATRLKRLQIGLGVEVDAAQPASSGHLRFMPVAGGQAAQWSITSEGARALRVGLAAASLPPGTQLRFSGAGQPGTVYGPFTPQDVAAAGATYWSPVLEGETALVEVFVPAASVAAPLDLRVDQVSHLFVSPAAPNAETLAKAAQICEVNFICRAATDAALAQTGRAVARMTFQDGVGGSGTSLCTGTLLNPSDGSFTPYFHSAAHCIDTQASAGTLTTHWFYESTSCAANVLSAAYVQVPGGATLLYANPASDVLLLRLNAAPPNGAFYAGWNNATVTQGQAMTAIHHPDGDLKKVSLGTAGGFESGTSVSSVTTGSFLRVNWNSTATGVTEGGSSGSGIFSSSGSGYQFRGGLLGGPSTCTATGSELNDIYSRFDQAYPFLAGYLSPSSGTCSHSLSASGQSVGASGGTGSFAVTTGNGCGWSASSNASWVTPSGSGAGSGTVTFSVQANPATTARSAVISVAGVSYTVSQAAGTGGTGGNALANPGFESGPAGWTEVASGGLAIVTSNAAAAHSGSWYAFLGGYNNGTDTLTQELTVPAAPARVQFWYRISTDEVINGEFDRLTVSLASPTTGLDLVVLARFSNQTPTSGWVQSPAYDISAFAGQRVRLRFHATTDGSDVTRFAIDDVTVTGATTSAAANYTSLWWDPDESGWGVNVNQQGDIAFATLFTYDGAGQPIWLVMSNGNRQGSADTFSGPLFRTTGPAFNANPFPPIGPQNLSQAGTMTLAFTGADSGTLTYTLDGSPVTKSIRRQVYGSRAATCAPTTGSRASATNYQDLWWRPGEDGWGINVTHQDDKLFATLFTYAAGPGTANAGVWYVMSEGNRQPDGSYLGTLYRTRGAVFNANPFPPLRPEDVTPVGTMRLRFASGTSGTLEYSIDNVPVTKSIERQVFSSPLPLCTS